MRSTALTVCLLLALWAAGNLPSEASAQSLLHGATASSHAIPSGWTALKVQGFEGGVDANKEFINASITSANAHTGTKSMGGSIAGDGGGVRWVLEQGNHKSREVYISYWDYMDSQATFNDEQFQAVFRVNNGSGATIQQQNVWYDWYWAANGAFNAPAGQLLVVSEGAGVGELHKAFYDSIYAPAVAPQRGQWAQFEIHYKANTAGAANGFYRGYVNGILRVNLENRNLNGSIDMIGMLVQIGGTYTKHIWRLGDGSIGNTCGTFIGHGAGSSRMTDWSTTTYDCGPVPPIFNRYFDDIIVMVPTGSGGGGQDIPAGPPVSPGGLTILPQ